MLHSMIFGGVELENRRNSISAFSADFLRSILSPPRMTQLTVNAYIVF
jgi:hypothetical protein